MEKKSILIVLSGNLCTGKSTLSNNLSLHNGFLIFKSREVLKKLAPQEYLSQYDTVREGLINYALELDEQTNGSWIADNLSFEIVKTGKVILDCVRLISQIEALKTKFKSLTNIYHIHLKCSTTILNQRFTIRDENKRLDTANAVTDFNEAREHIIELKSSELEPLADFVIQTDFIPTEDVYLKVKKILSL